MPAGGRRGWNCMSGSRRKGLGMRGAVVVRPRLESPEDRASRFMSMLTSGAVGSRAELARRMGCSRSYITKVLRRLPAAASR